MRKLNKKDYNPIYGVKYSQARVCINRTLCFIDTHPIEHFVLLMCDNGTFVLLDDNNQKSSFAHGSFITVRFYIGLVIILFNYERQMILKNIYHVLLSKLLRVAMVNLVF